MITQMSSGTAGYVEYLEENNQLTLSDEFELNQNFINPKNYSQPIFPLNTNEPQIQIIIIDGEPFILDHGSPPGSIPFPLYNKLIQK
jgi:hypothetical protein